MDICAVLVLHDLQDILEVSDLVVAIPGRPFTTSLSLNNCCRAEIFNNHRVGYCGHSGSDAPGNVSISPFIRAVRAALGEQPT
jgi:hypothetical protein